MAIHVLERSQLLRTTLSEAWDFFSTPKNLARITPSELGFSIRAPFDDRPAYTGQLITYSVKPLFGQPSASRPPSPSAPKPHPHLASALRPRPAALLRSVTP